MIRLSWQVIRSIVVIFDLLSIIDPDGLLSIKPKDIEALLCCLHSVLAVPNEADPPTKLFHPSSRDFLLSKQRCQDGLFGITGQEVHSTLCDRYPELMSNVHSSSVRSVAFSPDGQQLASRSNDFTIRL
jgi:WD40 repeat protein